MNRTISIAAAIFTVTAGPALAEGANLNFGGPLGTFTARPSPGGGGHYGAKSAYAKSAAQKKQRAVAQSRAAARRQEQVRQAAASRDGLTEDGHKMDTTSPAAPAIYVPPAPVAADPAGTTPEVAATSAIGPDLIVSDPGAFKPAPTEPAKDAANPAKPPCRKYSPAVGAVIDVACE